MLLGYARTSTIDQLAGLDAQLRELKAAGCAKVFKEQASAIGERPRLDEAIDFLDDEDTLVVTKLDRLARSVVHLGEILRRLEARGAALRVLAMGLDTRDATGRLMLNVLGSVAQFEREMMLERQREGIAKAKAEGRYRGRAPTARAKAAQAAELEAQGYSRTAIGKALKISRSSVQRILPPRKPLPPLPAPE